MRGIGVFDSTSLLHRRPGGTLGCAPASGRRETEAVVNVLAPITVPAAPSRASATPYLALRSGAAGSSRHRVVALCVGAARA
jgi:hypothetical protein